MNTHGNGNGNGLGHAGTAVLDEDETLHNHSRIVVDLEEDETRVSPEDAARPDAKRKKRARLPFVLLVVVVFAGIAVFLMFGGVFSGKKAGNVRVNARPEQQQEVTRAADADQSISSFATNLKSDAPVAAAPGAPITQTPGVVAGASPVTQPVFGVPPYDPAAPITSAPAPSTSPTSTAGVAGTVPGTTAGASTSTATGTTQTVRRDAPPAPIESEPASQSSSYFFNPPDVKPVGAGGGAGGVNGNETAFRPVSPFDKGNTRGVDAPGSPAAPVKPPFGAVLPVRVLGAVYTLRTDGYVRLELTRAVRGEGWSLQRGTQFIGKLSGAQNDRAFINLLGFIDPHSRKLVRVGGEVKGVDGGDGLKGERKRVGNRYLSALKQFGLPLGTAWLGSRGGGTQVIVPASSTVPGLDARTRVVEFVAVKAGTVGSVMITDLPEVIQGAQPDAPALDVQPGVEGLSDEEMIELITSNDPEAMRAAMPRMNATQRQFAERALREN